MPTKTVKDACYETKTSCFVIVHDVSYFCTRRTLLLCRGGERFLFSISFIYHNADSNLKRASNPRTI